MLLDRTNRRRALVAATAVQERSLGEVDGAVARDVGVEVEVIAVGVHELRLRPGHAGVVRLGHPRVAAGRAVERDVDVDAVIADRDRRLVVPRDVAVRVHGR